MGSRYTLIQRVCNYSKNTSRPTWHWRHQITRASINKLTRLPIFSSLLSKSLELRRLGDGSIFLLFQLPLERLSEWAIGDGFHGRERNCGEYQNPRKLKHDEENKKDSAISQKWKQLACFLTNLLP